MRTIKNFLDKMPGSFSVTFLIVFIFFILGINFPKRFAEITKLANISLFEYFGNFYMIFAFLALLVLLIIGISPLGKIKIGGEEASPKFSYLSWLAMLFCTGMGVGLMFWGVAEPLYHYVNPPVNGIENNYSQQITAFKMSFFHWGLTPWAIYGLTAMAVSFLGFNLKRGILFSSLILGKNKTGKKRKLAGQAVDLVTVIAIFFGIVTSFGMGVLLIEGGLGSLFNIEESFILKLLIILFATVFYMISSLLGLNRGIKILSNASMLLSFVLLGIVFWHLPKTQLTQYASETAYFYFKDFIDMSLGFLNYQSSDFLREWTVKYWSWWIAWAPFVGIFIAITSFGRTIRDIALSVLIIPSGYSFVWFIIFGAAAIQTQNMAGLPVMLDDAGGMLFNTVDFITKTPFVSWLAILVAGIFFVNSADSATYTLASFTKERNSLSEKPSAFLKIGWGVMFSAMTALFLFIGGIYILQEITLIFALPFTLMLLTTFVIFIHALIKYYRANFMEKIEETNIKPPLEEASAAE